MFGVGKMSPSKALVIAKVSESVFQGTFPTLHPTNPFFMDEPSSTDGGGGEEKLLQGQGALNPFLDRIESPMTEALRVVSAVNLVDLEVEEQKSYHEFIQRRTYGHGNGHVAQQPKTPDADTDVELILDQDIPISKSEPENESSWPWEGQGQGQGQRDPPSTYFPSQPSGSGSGKKVYRNRRTGSQDSSGTPNKGSTPKFLLELRHSLSSISLVPAVSSFPSLPTSGSRTSFHSQSRSSSDTDVQNGDSNDVYVRPRSRRKRYRRGRSQARQRKSQLNATSALGSKIIAILNTVSLESRKV
jgi:hypothetical protein